MFAAACGSSGGTPMMGDDDDMPTPDSMIPNPTPGTIRLSGQATETGLGGTSPVDGVAVAAFAKGDENTALASGTTDGDGNYTLTIEFEGDAFDGYVKATKDGYMDLYQYPTGALTADSSDGSFNMITPGNKNQLNNIANGGQQPGKGLIGLMVADEAGNPVEGATVTSTPASGAYRYMAGNGFPSSTASATASDGVAFMFGVPPDVEVTVTATKAGMTFKAHTLKARADVFTSTSIQP
jgi:hypothetical protein